MRCISVDDEGERAVRDVSGESQQAKQFGRRRRSARMSAPLLRHALCHHVGIHRKQQTNPISNRYFHFFYSNIIYSSFLKKNFGNIKIKKYDKIII